MSVGIPKRRTVADYSDTQLCCRVHIVIVVRKMPSHVSSPARQGSRSFLVILDVHVPRFVDHLSQ